MGTYLPSPMITDDAIKLFVQVALICFTIAITAFLYVLSGFFSFPQGFTIANNILWQLSHGLHGIIYFCFNRRIRTEVLRMCGRNKTQSAAVITTAIVDSRPLGTTNRYANK
ncbi:hypothetical protein OSTOST_02068 [Ostertagia ostertagi]